MTSRAPAAVVILSLAMAVCVPLAAVRVGSTLTPSQIPPGPPPTPEPTAPCATCGPTGQGPNVGFRAWAYPLHFCPKAAAPNAVYAIVYGMGKSMTGTLTFFGSINGQTRQLATLNPGQREIELGVPPGGVAPGQSFPLVVWATTDGTSGGPRALFGNGTTSRTGTLVCDCAPTPVPFGPPPTTPTGSSTPPQVNTVPASPFEFPPSL